ncbi:MAG: hypothetical protein AAGA56_13935 [Myxococcota bacterium]
MRIHWLAIAVVGVLAGAPSALAQPAPADPAAPPDSAVVAEPAPPEISAEPGPGDAPPSTPEESAPAEDASTEEEPTAPPPPVIAPAEVVPPSLPEPPPPADVERSGESTDAAPADGTRLEVKFGEDVEKVEDLVPSVLYDGGAKLFLGKRQENYIRFITWHQIWARYQHLNPGSTITDVDRNDNYDVGIRRSRFLILGQFAKRFQLLLHVGINNQTFNNERKPQVFVHEATAQFDVIKRHLSLGAGLHYWHGLSRITNASTLNFMTLDAPILNWPTIERTDQFARNLGIYVKGKVGPIDYRFAVNKPFVAGPEVPGPAADYNPVSNFPEVGGYVMAQLGDEEANAVPYMVGTYLGTKDVLNVGAGFTYHKNGTRSENPTDGGREHDIALFGADVFIDKPFGDKGILGAFTGYAVYYRYEFGPDHLRNVGIMNVAADGTTLNGPGAAYPTIGTGDHLYASAGYMLPTTWTGLQRLQPYVSVQSSWFEARDEVALIPEVGLNWHLLGHHAKLTVAYRDRPVYRLVGERSEVSTRRGEGIMQAMVYF